MSALSSWLRRSVRAGPAALALLLLPGNAQAAGPLASALAAQCPAKHLEWLNPGILIDGIDVWLAALPAGQKADVERRAKPALAKCTAGASCVNNAYIRSAAAAGALSALATAVCALPYRCTAPFTCDSGGR